MDNELIKRICEDNFKKTDFEFKTLSVILNRDGNILPAVKGVRVTYIVLSI